MKRSTPVSVSLLLSLSVAVACGGSDDSSPADGSQPSAGASGASGAQAGGSGGASGKGGAGASGGNQAGASGKGGAGAAGGNQAGASGSGAAGASGGNQAGAPGQGGSAGAGAGGAGAGGAGASGAGAGGAPAPTLPAGCALSSKPALLPQTFLDTTPVATTGTVVDVPAGGDLQAALDKAQPGDELRLAAGATFTGNFVLRKKATAGWITVRTSTPDASFVAPGTRAQASDAPKMAKIVTPSSAPAIALESGAAGYRLVGLEVTVTESVQVTYSVVYLGVGGDVPPKTLAEVPHDIVLDRVYVHGTPTSNLRRCVALNSASSAVIDSSITECHSVGFDSQAIYGWNGPGPFKIVNNLLEGSTENLGFGGPTPSIEGLIPSDVEIRRNHVRKLMSWREGDPSYAGTHWLVKNLFELKSGARMLIEDNVFENNWPDGQVGYGWLIQSLSDDNTAPWNNVRDIVFHRNILRHSAMGYNMTARVAYGANPVLPDMPSQRLCVTENLFVDVGNGAGPLGGDGRLFGMNDDLQDVVIVHNTGAASSTLMAFDGSPPGSGLVVRDNLFGLGTYGIFGNSKSPGKPSLDAFAPGYVVTGNVFFGMANASAYPDGNTFAPSAADVGFADFAGGDYALAPSSPYKGKASDSKDPGADAAAVLAATAGVVSP